MTIEEMKKKKQECGYSNIQLSELSGVPIGTLQKIFSGETKSPRRDTLLALEKVLFRKERYPAYTAPRCTSGLLLAETVAAYAKEPMKRQGEYTVEDYFAIPDEYRTELIDGYIYDMASPTRFHQLAAGEIYRQIANYIFAKGGDCIPGIAPIDVQLDCDNKTMVQPDVIIVCKPEIYNEKNVFGAPDFVVEILSPSTRQKDLITKLFKYCNSGVREFWIVDPVHETITVHFFELEQESPWTYPLDADIPVRIYDGDLVINLSTIKKWFPS
ncbi:MAG: Uma2 family endonuclease [Lachnospiraceae bacterium]|nr:Uma2 family endonuclease [Lachnospiraceae bacterium]